MHFSLLDMRLPCQTHTFMCKSVAFVAAELLGSEQWAEKEMAAHTKTVEEANLSKVELQDAIAKLLDATKNVVTLKTNNEELKREVSSIRAQLDSVTSVVGSLKLEVGGLQAEVEGLRRAEAAMTATLKREAFMDAKFQELSSYVN